MTNDKQARISTTYVLVTIIAVSFTWLIHELGHWCTGELLCNEMVMTLNSSYPLKGEYGASWHATIISAVGPIITILQAIIFYLLMRRNESNLLFPFLLTALYMRTLAGIMNLVNLNDEGRISRDFGIGPFTIPLLVFGILAYLVYTTSTTKKYKGKFIASSILLIMLFSSVLILLDQAMRIIIL